MGRNQISSFACNTIKTSSNDDKWRQQRGVSQPRQSASSAAAAANLLRSLTKKLIIKKNLKWNFLAAIWHNNHRDTPGESACRMKLKISWIWIHSVDVKPLPPPPPPPSKPSNNYIFLHTSISRKIWILWPKLISEINFCVSWLHYLRTDIRKQVIFVLLKG